MPHHYRDDLLELCEDKLTGDQSIQRAQMMGFPGWRIVVNNKFFIFVGEQGIVLKLPPDRYEQALERDDVEAFNPSTDASAKPMSTWIEWIKPDAPEYHDEWEWFVNAARSHVTTEAPNKKKKKV